MEDLLPYFERELVMLRRHCREFSERYPRIAGKLHMSGESCEDPHVEHLIESVAMLAARISKRLDDDYPQFTEALFEALFPIICAPFHRAPSFTSPPRPLERAYCTCRRAVKWTQRPCAACAAASRLPTA